MNRKFNYLFVMLLFFNFSMKSQVEIKKTSFFRDSIDNAVDISNWLGNKKGFLLVPAIITEPAVGYGAVAAAIYFHSSIYEKGRPPSMSGVMGGGTQNSTWMAGIFHAGFWFKDKVRYTGAIARTNTNIGFYGSGSLGIIESPVNLNMDAWILFQQLKSRIGKSNFFIGGRYTLLDTYNTFDTGLDTAYYQVEASSRLSEASLVVNFDSRNNIFTPTEGYYANVSATYSDEWMGGDALYGRIGIDLIGYFQSGNHLNLGIRSETNYTMGDVPLYARPFVKLRGAPMLKYQDANTTLVEAELSVNVTNRWSLIGFTGLGNAFENYAEFSKGKSVQTIGTGFRYFIARKFGAKMGMDFAFSQEDFAFYFVFGSSWLK
jgi:hypothetical protein